MSPLCTALVASWVGEAWTALGQPQGARDLAHDLRIGGACDTKDACHGDAEAAYRMLDQRGRWDSLIGDIYAHDSATALFETSRAVVDVADRSVQELVPGWAHPTRQSRKRPAGRGGW